MAKAGYNLLVTCATGVGTTSATFTAINGIKSFTLSDSRTLLDITDFADGDIMARLQGLRDISVSLSGDLEAADVGFLNLQAAYTAGNDVGLAVYTSANATTAGFIYRMAIESLEYSGSADGKAEISASLMINASAGSAVFSL